MALSKPIYALGDLLTKVPFIAAIRDAVADHFSTDTAKWRAAFFLLVFVILAKKLKNTSTEEFIEITKHKIFKKVRAIPLVRNKINVEIEKAGVMLRANFNPAGSDAIPSFHTLPKKGLANEEILSYLDKLATFSKYKWDEGKVSGAVYGGDSEIADLCTQVYRKTVWTNPLHPDLFPDVRRMEAEVVRMCCTLFHGDANSSGTMTFGGTESILLACKTFCHRARENGITHPEILIPVTAHAAFDKAAQLLNCSIRHIAVDPKTKAVNVKAMRRAISSRTCMIVGSAPCYPYGTIDPIAELSALAVKYRVPLHVDCCLGGFIVAFTRKAGYGPETAPGQTVDFALPGVMSISCDPHKYGFTPKGASVIMYRNDELRRFQYFSAPSWPGGIYASPTMAGSRPGQLIATCWSTLLHYGEDRYIESVRKIIEVAQYIRAEVKKIPSLELLGRGDLSIVAFAASAAPDDKKKRRFNIYILQEMMGKRGWSLNALQFPPGIHICCTLMHARDDVGPNFIKDLKACIQEIESNPSLKASDFAVFYGATQQLPDRSIVSELTHVFLDSCYSLAPLPPSGSQEGRFGSKGSPLSES